MIKQFVKAEIVDKSSDAITAIASTETIDRHGEIVSVEGWNLKNFKKAPRILWSHDHTIPAIGRATKIWVEGTGKSAKLMFKAVFQDITDLGKQAKALVDGGWIDTFSVGFMADEMIDNKFTKQELLEISLVNVPANPDAQITAYKMFSEAGVSPEQMKAVGVDVHYVELKQKTDILMDKVDLVVKALEQGVNPKVEHQAVTDDRLSSSKVMAKAVDKILANKTNMSRQEVVSLAKVIKRTNEKLAVQFKKDL